MYGPAASTGARARAVWDTNAERWPESVDAEAFDFFFPPSAFPFPLGQFVPACRGDDVAAVVAGFGPDVDDPIGGLDDVEIVLDDDDRVAQIDQAIEHVEQLGDIVEVQAGRRFVEQIERVAGIGPGEFGGQLHALRFAAGERRRAWPSVR